MDSPPPSLARTKSTSGLFKKKEYSQVLLVEKQKSTRRS